MRRPLGLVLTALLALAVLAAPGAALADEAGGGVIVLAEDVDDALEEPEDAELGPDPMPREVEDNPARELGGYGDVETPFTWGAAFIMLFLGSVGLALMGGLYWLLVHRPEKQKQAEQEAQGAR